MKTTPVSMPVLTDARATRRGIKPARRIPLEFRTSCIEYVLINYVRADDVPAPRRLPLRPARPLLNCRARPGTPALLDGKRFIL